MEADPSAWFAWIALLDRAWFGALLLDADGEIVSMNRAACALLLGRPSATTRMTKQLRELAKTVWQRVAHGRPGRIQQRTGTTQRLLKVTLGERRLRCVEWALPTSRPGWASSAPCQLILMVPPAEVAPASLEQQWSLSMREAEVAAAIIEGASVEEAAQRLGIALETARGHLKRAFRKSGARSQTDLVRRYLTGPYPWLQA